MHKLLKLIVLTLLPGLGFSQTMTTSGDWDNSANWTAGNIGDLITENVTLDNGVDPTVRTGFNYTIGDLTTGNNNDLIIQTGASLTLGASGNPKNLSTTNNTTLTIGGGGTLIIWGNLDVNNNVIWNVTGTVIIKGNINLFNNAVITVGGTGAVQVDGDLTGGNNTAMTVNGNITIGGNLSVGNGSTIAGTGTVTVGGTCSDGTSTFCGQGPLPISLLFFQGKSEGNGVVFTWSTASELNNDFFTIERLNEGDSFDQIAVVKGSGTINELRTYQAIDFVPNDGKNYYHLKQTDYDGQFSYSKIVMVDFVGSGDAVSVYPNQVNQEIITIEVKRLQPGQQVPLQIRSSLGVQAYSATYAADATGNIKVSIQVDKWSQGLYLIQIGTDTPIQRKIIIE